MKYSIYRALQKLWIHKKIYAVIALELAIGMAVVLCGISAVYSAKSRQGQYKQQIGEQGVAVESFATGDFADAGSPVTVEDYEKIKEKQDGWGISYLLYMHTIYLTGESSDVRNVTFASMDADTFKRFFGFAPQEDTAYLGAQVADDLEREGLSFLEEWVSCGGSKARIGELDVAKIARLDAADESIFVEALTELKIGTMMVLPEKCMGVLERNAEDPPNACLRILPGSDGAGTEALPGIVQMLRDKHPDYAYRVSEQYLELQKSITDLTEDIRFFSWIAWFVLVITMVGIVGIWLIYMEKRRREFAVMLSLGGTHATIFREIFLEIFSLCILGGCIGLAAAAIITPHLSTSVFTAHFQGITVAAMLGIVLMITAISCTCMILGIRDVYPTKILKK